MIAAALVLVSVAAGWYQYASQSATGEPEVAPAGPTQVHTGVATPDEIDESEYLNWDGTINMDDSVDLRVGDCFDLKHPLAEIENVKKVPCSAEHDYELFPDRMQTGNHDRCLGRSHPTEHAFLDYVIEYCDPRSMPISVRRTTIPTSTTSGWSRPRMPGDRAIGPCNAPPTIR